MALLFRIVSSTFFFIISCVVVMTKTQLSEMKNADLFIFSFHHQKKVKCL